MNRNRRCSLSDDTPGLRWMYFSRSGPVSGFSQSSDEQINELSDGAFFEAIAAGVALVQVDEPRPLADGDLEGAMTPAYWLSQHDALEGIPEDLQSYVTGIRAAASSVEEASDLETARAEAQRITEECQGCHDATGIEVN